MKPDIIVFSLPSSFLLCKTPKFPTFIQQTWKQHPFWSFDKTAGPWGFVKLISYFKGPFQASFSLFLYFPDGNWQINAIKPFNCQCRDSKLQISGVGIDALPTAPQPQSNQKVEYNQKFLHFDFNWRLFKKSKSLPFDFHPNGPRLSPWGSRGARNQKAA